MPQPDLRDKFPSMTPVRSAPTLTRINGCGVSLYGKRDFDAETRTYVSTWCFALIFVPVFCLRAYRVADGPRGWYFIGREPLSLFAKVWNISLIAAILFAIGLVKYEAYTSTPAYKAKQKMAEAQSLAEEGKLADAARIDQQLVVGGTPEAENAAKAIAELIDEPCLQAPLAEAAGVYAAASPVARQGRGLSTNDLADKGLKLVADRGATDPRSAVAILDTIRPLVVNAKAIDDQRLTLLRKWAAAEPKNVEAIAPLALILEGQGKAADAKKLLMPVKDQLGDGEGARALGLILGHEGDFDGAYGYLWPYVKPRLDRLHAAEQSSEATLKQLWDRELKSLNDNQGPPEFYEKYKVADRERQHVLVEEYVNGQIKNDPQYISSQEALASEVKVVPVAIELGMIILQRAQSLPDPAARKKQLESAEEVFLAIGGVAGESDVYRLSLGQVYYWLGKHAEGRKLFDEYLASKQRGANELLQIAGRLHELGAVADARQLAEESYSKGSSDEQHAAAQVRALCAKDLDDEIEWLQKADTSYAPIKARLATGLGRKAYQEGREDEAVTQYRAAIDALNTMPRNSNALNETAIAYFALFQATGDRQALDRCLDCFQQAVEMSPSDAVLLYNAGVTLLEGGLADVIGAQIDLHAVRQTGSPTLLGFIYHDKASRDAVAKQVLEHSAIVRAMSYLEKARVLSPKRPASYSALSSMYRFTRNDAALATLAQRLTDAAPETDDELAAFKEALAGTKDDQNKTALNAAIKRNDQLIDKLRKEGGRSLAVVLVEQAGALMALDPYGETVDMDRVSKLATEAHQVAPSSVTEGTLLAVHLMRVAKDLRAKDPQFDAFCKKHARSISMTHLMAVVVSEPGPFQAKAQEHPDFKAAISIVKNQITEFPDSIAESHWALLKGTDPAAAEKAAEVIRHTPRQTVVQSIDSMLRPFGPGEAVETYWLTQIQGKPEAGREALRKVAQRGLPVPIEP